MADGHIFRTILYQRDRLDEIVAHSTMYRTTNANVCFPIYFRSRQLRDRFPKHFGSVELRKMHPATSSSDEELD